MMLAKNKKLIIRSIVIAIALASSIICCYLFCSHNNPGWTNVYYLESHENLLSFIMLISFLIIIFGTWKYIFDDDFVMNMIWISVALMFYLYIFSIPIIVRQDTEISAYKPENIEAVYSDDGEAVQAKVQYHVNDGISSGITCKHTVEALGYKSIVVDDHIVEPKEKNSPEGATLVIPQSYMRKK